MIASERIMDKGKKSADKYNQKHKLVRFEVGEEILLKSNPVSSTIDNTIAKFFPIFNGPYVIDKQVAKHTYIIKDVAKNRIIGKYHGNSLRKYKKIK